MAWDETTDYPSIQGPDRGLDVTIKGPTGVARMSHETSKPHFDKPRTVGCVGVGAKALSKLTSAADPNTLSSKKHFSFNQEPRRVIGVCVDGRFRMWDREGVSMRQRKTPWMLVLLACSITLFLTACSSEEETTGDDCVDDKQFFQKEVWSNFMQNQCVSCHTPGGVADRTNLVLQPATQTGFLDANMTKLRDVAALERDGTSILLLKPSEIVPHDGGMIFEEGSEKYVAMQEMIARFNEPVSCGEASARDEHFQEVTLLDPNETFRKATLNVAGRLPTAAEDFAIATGGEEALDQQLDLLLREDAFYTRLELIVNDMFLTDRYLGRNEAIDLLDTDFYPDARWHIDDDDENPKDYSNVNAEFLENARMYTNDSMARENLKLASFIVRNDRPFTEIVTADYMVMNPYTARAYGVTGIDFENSLDQDEWKEGRVAGIPHAGVLSSAMWLNRFPTTATNRNRHRSRMVYWFFLATDVNKLAERPLDPTNITAFNPTMNNPNCNVCHNVIDPIAGTMMNWNTEGSYSPPEDGWFTNMLPPGFGDAEMPYDGAQEYAAVQWLGQQIANDRRFATSVVHHMYRGLTGQEPLLFPTDTDSPTYQEEVLQYEVQDQIFDEIAQSFIDSDFNLRTVFKELMKSKYFRVKNVLDPERAPALAELGMGRMLTPELLDEKIKAVTGMYWEDNNGDHYLLDGNEYRMLYGGIDSDDVTVRMTDPNGIMAGIQMRMSNEMACRITARDFTQKSQDRRLFPHVDAETAPMDEAGFPDIDGENAVRKNIAHLHYHILGERLETNDEEVTRTFNLFLETLQEGRLKMTADELDGGLRCRAETDFDGVELPEENRITRDDTYTIRAWMAVVTYLLADYNFLYE